MSDMKCAFCNGELVGTMGHPICRNQNCVMCDDPMPQDLLEELIRTRKALNVATERLEQIAHESFQGDQQSINLGFHIRAAAALTDIEQITALEQKV